jgi:hypothetical protein
MQLIFEKSPPKSPIHIVWGVMMIALVMAGAIFGEYLDLLPACAFKSVTGIPCLTCGGTRSILALSQFDLVSAFLFNPLAVLIAIALILFSAAIALGIIFRKSVMIKLSRGDAKIARILIAAAIAINWAYLILSSRDFFRY